MPLMGVVPTQVSGTSCPYYADRASKAWRSACVTPVDPLGLFPATGKTWVESLGASQVSLLQKHRILDISQGQSRG